MGACFDSVRIAACDKTELKEKFSRIQDHSCQENGSDAYAGHIGIAQGLDISSKVFKDQSKAEDWLSENAEKWGPAIAVQVGDFSQIYPKTDAEKKQYNTFTALQEEFSNWDLNILKRVKSAKSAQRTCVKCFSKITVSYIKSNACPVCHDINFLQTETDIKKFKALQLKHQEMKKKVHESKQKYVEKNKNNFWLVGAMCAS